MNIDVISIICEYCDINILYNIHLVLGIMDVIKPIMFLNRYDETMETITDVSVMKFAFRELPNIYPTLRHIIMVLTDIAIVDNNIDMFKILMQHYPRHRMWTLDICDKNLYFIKYVLSMYQDARMLSDILAYGADNNDVETVKFICSMCDPYKSCVHFHNYGYLSVLRRCMRNGYLEIVDIMCRSDHADDADRMRDAISCAECSQYPGILECVMDHYS